MITYTTGDMFEADVYCLVNTVNCEGHMGRGIAYQFKLKYPKNNEAYVKACEDGELRIGKLHSFEENGKLIVNFPTKNRWREKSNLSYIETGLDLLVALIKEKSIDSIAIPPLGCGNGGLVWEEVKRFIESKLSSLGNDCNIIVYEPSVITPTMTKTVPKLTLSSLILLQTKMHLNKWDYMRMQTACFFVNYFARKEVFKFDKLEQGPFSKEVDVLANDIKEYQKYYGLKDSKQTYEQAYKVVISQKADRKLDVLLPAIEKAAGYVNDISENRELEMISSILFMIQRSENPSEDGLIKMFMDKPAEDDYQYSESDIAKGIEYLENTGLINKNILGFEVNEYD